MSSPIGAHGGYRRTYSFGYTCLIYHATCTFCRKNLNHINDPLGKTAGQMIGAARSARQNIVEGSSRAGTSRETELKLFDVAKGSLEELAGDYEAFLEEERCLPWNPEQEELRHFKTLRLDEFTFQGDYEEERYEYGKYFLKMRERFAPWLEADEAIKSANSILVTIDQARKLLARQIQVIALEITEQGGFTERLSQFRIRRRNEKALEEVGNAESPICPICGKPMRKILAQRGKNAGKAFWGCIGYPDCRGTRDL